MDGEEGDGTGTGMGDWICVGAQLRFLRPERKVKEKKEQLCCWNVGMFFFILGRSAARVCVSTCFRLDVDGIWNPPTGMLG